MRYFIQSNRSVLTRLGICALLLVTTVLLTLTVVPTLAPANYGYIPIILFGGLALSFGIHIGNTKHSNKADRRGAIGVTVFAAALVGGMVGSGVNQDVALHRGYGWFLAATCGGLALVGATIGLIAPRHRALRTLKTGWRIARDH